MEDKTRVQFDFTPEALQILDRQTKEIGGDQRATGATGGIAVRYGLRLLDWALEQKKAGNKILIETPDGLAQEVIFTFLQ